MYLPCMRKYKSEYVMKLAYFLDYKGRKIFACKANCCCTYILWPYHFP